jgi:hypothetical protein
VGARDDDARPALQVQPEGGGPGEQRVAVGQLARQDVADERCRRGLGGALRRADALDLRGDERGDQAQQAAARRVLRAGPHPQGSHRRVGDPQLDRLDAARVGQQRLLVGRRQRGHGQHGARPVLQDQARVEGARGGADDLRQARARRHGLRDVVQRPEVEPGRRPFGRDGHRRIVGALTVVVAPGRGRGQPWMRSQNHTTAAPPAAPTPMNAAST